ncbi:peroxiredoxin [Seleniivibrio woodruffii]|uniref:Alkyl hydroperoxide reductase C n=1 Tax=Seleniivibrio woodruffii TaxID=1078050 RepID=A0A4R1K7H4_9BACT|nr:peroxiredoxin [Seleniivibrio woodruffii]TCK59990.1 peroxiredoxin (alkyl hydroperoxide reductase subunit C) [Seleniivibrio woodruffii]TVZ35789.1 peroxiredoxin (alkyl hydroperoxide reductase subunit C) [Seleniivibrio woodruffii]
MSLVTKQAPAFSEAAVLNKQFKNVSLEDYKGKWVVLFFYPLDFTFVCPTEITALSDANEEFAKRDAQIIGVSTDSKFSHLAWVNTPRSEGGLGDIAYPLVADFTKSISTDYGVLLDGGMALRATFIIDPEGKVQFELVHDLGIGRNVTEILRNLDALQFVRKHGEVCPAGWTPGKDTMKPDPEKSKDYYKNNPEGWQK